MVIALVIVSFIAVGTVEIWRWPRRSWQKVVVYLVLLAAAAAFSILILTVDELPVPGILGPLDELLSSFWPGGGA
ncbi:MAG: hypothetical protein GX251_11600 [Firmicutes bacterium]|nr:hypothetical protein [Bacillota bacterium]